jgi:3-oxoacyl-[acyl-carrier-protein] synthase III
VESANAFIRKNELKKVMVVATDAYSKSTVSSSSSSRSVILTCPYIYMYVCDYV